MRRFSTIFLAAMLASTVAASSASAQVFKYKDEEGRTHYVTDADKVPAKYQEQVSSPHDLPKINKVKSLSGPLPVRTSTEGSYAPDGSKKVEIFVTSWCPYCTKLEKFLREERIQFTRYDIERNKSGARKYSKLGMQGVPIVRIGSTIIPGYNPNAIRAALNN
ncbi:MAG: DUF4124 domain-containing protein [Bdellovibrionales bacterium]|nr:DUF4124 domain-containing protein [Bdellovibrionales bacterium]